MQRDFGLLNHTLRVLFKGGLLSVGSLRLTQEKDSAAFKAKVAVEALTEGETLVGPAERFQPEPPISPFYPKTKNFPHTDHFVIFALHNILRI